MLLFNKGPRDKWVSQGLLCHGTPSAHRHLHLQFLYGLNWHALVSSQIEKLLIKIQNHRSQKRAKLKIATFFFLSTNEHHDVSVIYATFHSDDVKPSYLAMFKQNLLLTSLLWLQFEFLRWMEKTINKISSLIHINPKWYLTKCHKIWQKYAVENKWMQKMEAGVI